MTIPEPDGETLAIDLQSQYGHVYDGVQLTQIGIRKLISRAYHAERLVDQLRQWKETQTKFHTELLNQYEKLENEADRLRARVAELENLVEDVLINERDGHLLPIELAGGVCEWQARRSDAMKLEAKGVAGE